MSNRHSDIVHENVGEVVSANEYNVSVMLADSQCPLSIKRSKIVDTDLRDLGVGALVVVRSCYPRNERPMFVLERPKRDRWTKWTGRVTRSRDDDDQSRLSIVLTDGRMCGTMMTFPWDRVSCGNGKPEPDDLVSIWRKIAANERTTHVRYEVKILERVAEEPTPAPVDDSRERVRFHLSPRYYQGSGHGRGHNSCDAGTMAAILAEAFRDRSVPEWLCYLRGHQGGIEIQCRLDQFARFIVERHERYKGTNGIKDLDPQIIPAEFEDDCPFVDVSEAE